MRSALYEGVVRHHRRGPRPHAFSQRLFLVYLDLDELPGLFDRAWLASARRPAPVWFRRADYFGPAGRPLREAVLDRVEAELGRRPSGAVGLLTHLRTWGYLFNPVSFYYCFDAAQELEAVVAEITNTPWNERHAYVLDARASDARLPGGERVWRFSKAFHVSPFHDMDQEYVWRLSPPGEHLTVHMTNVERGEAVFSAGLTLQRRELGARALCGALLRHPLLTLRVHAAIYVQALRLALKRTPFFVHPARRRVLPEVETT